MNKLTRLLLLFLAFQFLLGCTTQKRRDQQGLLARAWHNTNAHFNGYFNAREILEESFLLLEEQHQDNYNQQLDMFPFLATDNPSVVFEELDRAVEKVTVVTRVHPYSNWTDDCYLLAGQAQFIKQDYESAEQTFRYVVNEFRPRPKRKKGKKINPNDPDEADDEPRGPKVELTAAQERRERIRARDAARKERDRYNKQLQKERKKAKRERDKERKQRIRDRKKGITTPRSSRRDTMITSLDDPETQAPTTSPDEAEEGPFVGMISIFNESRDLGLENEAYGDKPDSYFMKHRPVFQEGRLWLAWTLVKRDNYDQAQLILEDLRNDRGTFADVRRKAMAVQAFLFLESNRPALAIPYLMEAAEASKDRNEEARFYYIAGQLHQQLNEPSAAYQAFELVVAAKPQYDLEFGALLNMAQNDYLSGAGTAEDAIRRLEKMRKDEKNAAYESQLYFSMANVALRSGNEPLGMEYLQKALASPSAQPNNRIEAYNLLARLNYDQSDYLAAKLYYDSTLMSMTRSDARYAPTAKLRDDLVEIAGLIQDINLKDSLLRISELPEEQRLALAEKMLQAQRDAQKMASEAGIANETPRRPGPTAVNLSTSNFWAYDSRTARRGMRDFNRKFGDRVLEDNWRRSNRADRNLFTDPDDNITTTESGPILVTEEEAANLLKGVPTDDRSRDAMRLELQEAMFNLGRLYRNQLEDNGQTVAALEEMHRRFPKTNFEAESWYYLYLAHTDLGNVAEAQSYKDKLLQKWGDTKYAKIISDPNYAATVLDEEAQRERAYAAAYQLFEAGAYEEANKKAKAELNKLFGQHPLKPKYALLLAMTTGNLQGKEAYIVALRQVVSQYNGTPEQTRAKEILRLLGQGGAALPGGTRATAGGNFKPGPNELHYLILVFDSRDINLNEAKIALSDYNNKYHKLDRLRIKNVFLGRDNSVPVLVMRRFKNKEDIMDYYNSALENKTEFLSRTEVDYTLYPVSQSNYREVLKARSVDGYDAFFRENY